MYSGLQLFFYYSIIVVFVLNYFSLVTIIIALSVFALNPLCPMPSFSLISNFVPCAHFSRFNFNISIHCLSGATFRSSTVNATYNYPFPNTIISLYMTCPFFLFASDKCFCVGLSIEPYYLLYFYYYRYWFIFCIRQIIVLFII